MGLVDKLMSTLDNPAMEFATFVGAFYNFIKDKPKGEDPKQRVANKTLDTLVEKHALEYQGKSPREIEEYIDNEIFEKYKLRKGMRYEIYKRTRLLEAYYVSVGKDFKAEHAEDVFKILFYGRHPKLVNIKLDGFITKNLYRIYDNLLFRPLSMVT